MLNGLQRMEYRGYDSAGLEIEGDEPGKPLIFKEVGKVQFLKKHCLESPVDMHKTFLSQTSIAHTRCVPWSLSTESRELIGSGLGGPLTERRRRSTATRTSPTRTRSLLSCTTASSPFASFPLLTSLREADHRAHRTVRP